MWKRNQRKDMRDPYWALEDKDPLLKEDSE